MTSISLGPVSLGFGGGTTPINSPLTTAPPTGSSALPVAGASGFTAAQQVQLKNALDAAGVWGTIQNLGGDVWGVISKVLPKNADGSIDWGGALKDVGSWVKDHAGDILTAASAYNSYERQNKADTLGQQAVAAAEKSYDAKQPLRDAGMAGMLNPKAGTPDLSALSAQGQAPRPVAPLPVAAPTTNLNNAQRLANGPMSPNPFTKQMPSGAPPLPVAGAPGVPSGPSGPSGPAPTPMRPLTPSLPAPLPIASAPPLTAPVTPGAPMSTAQSGLIKNGPQNKTYNAPVDPYGRPVLALPVAGA